MPAGLFGSSAVYYADLNSIIVFGGHGLASATSGISSSGFSFDYQQDSVRDTLNMYNIDTGVWIQRRSPPAAATVGLAARYLHRAVLIGDYMVRIRVEFHFLFSLI